MRQDKCFFVSSTSVTWHLATGTYQATGPTGRKAKILKAVLQLTSMWKAFCNNTVTSSAGLASYSDCVWGLYVYYFVHIVMTRCKQINITYWMHSTVSMTLINYFEVVNEN